MAARQGDNFATANLKTGEAWIDSFKSEFGKLFKEVVFLGADGQIDDYKSEEFLIAVPTSMYTSVYDEEISAVIEMEILSGKDLTPVANLKVSIEDRVERLGTGFLLVGITRVQNNFLKDAPSQ